MEASPAQQKNTSSKTVTDTIVGEDFGVAGDGGCCEIAPFADPNLFPLFAGGHTHTIVGYSLIKGIGDGEPIASDRFSVGGHEWVSKGGRVRLEGFLGLEGVKQQL